MSALRPTTSLLLHASRQVTARPLRQFGALPQPSIRHAPAIIRPQGRAYSSEAPPTKHYTFEEIRKLYQSPSSKAVLVDTREPSELQATGTIPTSVNIPVTSAPDAFFLPPKEFEERFGFERPGKDVEVVFYCKAGVRSRVAAALARQAGWVKISEYSGSWLDWEKRGGEKQGGRS